MVRYCPWIWSALIVLVAACSSDRGSQAAPDTALAGATGAGAPAAGSGAGAAGTLATATPAAGATATAPGRAAGSGGSTPTGAAGRSGAAGAAVSGSGGAAAGAGSSAAGASGSVATAAGTGSGGMGGMSSSTSGRGSAGASGGGSAAGAGGSGSAGLTPVYRVPVRFHVGMSKLTDAELQPIFAELNSIWLKQAGVCFEIEVTTSETNRMGGFDFRYTSGTIPGASSANGLTQNAHSIWSIDHPRLNDVSMPVMNPTSRTTAHELGHALNLAHQNPPPSTDCSSPCYCAQLDGDCDEYLMRSGTKGFRISKPEVDIARKAAAKVALADQAPTECGAPVFMR